MRVIPAFLLFSVLAACKGDPVSWSDPLFRDAPAMPSEYAGTTTLPDSTGCPASLRLAAIGKLSYSVWWRVNADSSASLMVARSGVNGGWAPPVIADSSDHSNRGCGRPAPAIAVDAMSGYVDLAYYLEPAAGSGVFFAHSMDRAATFHAPVPVVFGRNPSSVSIATHRDRVAVAYEDPNSGQPIIGVALSVTMGHLFESRVEATTENERAKQPVVRLSGDSIQLWWREYSANPAISATHATYRAGYWR